MSFFLLHQKGIGCSIIHPVSFVYDANPPFPLPGFKLHAFLKVPDGLDFYILAFRFKGDNIKMIFMIRLPAGITGITGIPVICPAVQGFGKGDGSGLFTYSLHAIKKKGMGCTVLDHGTLQMGNLLFVTEYISERHIADGLVLYLAMSFSNCAHTSRCTAAASREASMIRYLSGSASARVR